MLNNNVFYHGTIRKCIVAFGTLFSDIYIDRREGNSVTGTVAQRLQIPLAYAPKEKYLVRIEQDPNLENNTYISLPRMSFEILGYSYDSSRKLNRMQQIKCGDGTNTMDAIYTPVPYNIDVPIVLNSVTSSDEYDGDFQTRRNVTHTLTFTIKTNLFGPLANKKVIDEVFANIGQNEDFSNPNRIYTAEGDVTTATVDTESWTSNF